MKIERGHFGDSNGSDIPEIPSGYKQKSVPSRVRSSRPDAFGYTAQLTLDRRVAQLLRGDCDRSL